MRRGSLPTTISIDPMPSIKRLSSLVLLATLFTGVFLGIPQRAKAAENVILGNPPANAQIDQNAIQSVKAMQNLINNQTPSLLTTGATPCGTVSGTSTQVPDSIPCGLMKMVIISILGAGDVGNTADSKTGDKSVYFPGAIPGVLSMTSIALAHPPVNTSEYVADLMQNVSHPFAPTAYAQGLGFSSLSPVLSLWKMFRNLAYFFFVIIFLVVGFLIMFRSKIGSQAAVTVQQALPKLVISLILVTFSYAIAGLMLDLMYLIIYLLIGVFAFGSGALSAENLRVIAFQNNIFTNGFKIIGELVGGVAGAIGEVVNNLTTSILGSNGLAQAAGKFAGGATNVIATLVLAIAVLVSLFRVFFALVQAYIGIFFSVIFAPLQLLVGALPGQNTFGTWIKGLLENMLVFPTLILLIFIAYYFTIGPTFVAGNTGFTAPQLGTNQGSTSNANAYKGLLALGAILAMPEVLKVTKGLMKGQMGVGMEDLKKNFEAGRKHLFTPVKVGANIAGGAAVGALGARELARGTNYRGAATALGALGGGLFGVTTGLPVKLGSKAIGGLGTQSGRALAATGIRRGTNVINTRRANDESRRRAEEAAAATANIPAGAGASTRAGGGDINDGRT